MIRARSRRLLTTALAALIAGVAGILVVILGSAGGSASQSHLTPLGVTIAHPPAQPNPGLRSATTPTASVTGDARPESVTTRPTPPISRLLGQLIVARFTGTQPSSAFLARIKAGQIGGVILFADNVANGPGATRQSIQQLQHAAAQGGNPPLLVMTDQEGGSVRRLPGPPDLAPSDMSSDSTALQEGRATGKLLRAIGVNVDLAPVADVERVPGSFLGTRSFGDATSVVAARACAFAQGLKSQRVAYTLKHFPGLGRATSSTDGGRVSIDAPATALRDDYQPYLTCASSALAIVMVSSAVYPNLSGPLPAVMSPMIYHRELRIAVRGPAGPTISDDLQALALTGQDSPARHAINAGLDLVMYAQTEQASANAYLALLADVQSGNISVRRMREAAQTIETLKRSLTGM